MKSVLLVPTTRSHHLCEKRTALDRRLPFLESRVGRNPRKGQQSQEARRDVPLPQFTRIWRISLEVASLMRAFSLSLSRHSESGVLRRVGVDAATAGSATS